jgi:hypothetical protein
VRGGARRWITLVTHARCYRHILEAHSHRTRSSRNQRPSEGLRKSKMRKLWAHSVGTGTRNRRPNLARHGAIRSMQSSTLHSRRACGNAFQHIVTQQSMLRHSLTWRSGDCRCLPAFSFGSAGTNDGCGESRRHAACRQVSGHLESPPCEANSSVRKSGGGAGASAPSEAEQYRGATLPYTKMRRFSVGRNAKRLTPIDTWLRRRKSALIRPSFRSIEFNLQQLLTQIGQAGGNDAITCPRCAMPLPLPMRAPLPDGLAPSIHL